MTIQANLRLARLLIPLAPLGVLAAIAVQAVNIAAHFIAKVCHLTSQHVYPLTWLQNDLINQCVQNTVGDVEISVSSAAISVLIAYAKSSP